MYATSIRSLHSRIIHFKCVKQSIDSMWFVICSTAAAGRRIVICFSPFLRWKFEILMNARAR